MCFKEADGTVGGCDLSARKGAERPKSCRQKGRQRQIFRSVLLPPFKCVSECVLLGFLLLDFKFHCSDDVTFALAFPALPFNNHQQHILPALQFGELKKSSLVG